MLLTISASVFAGRFAIRLATSCAKAVAVPYRDLPTKNPAHRRSRSSGRWGWGAVRRSRFGGAHHIVGGATHALFLDTRPSLQARIYPLRPVRGPEESRVRVRKLKAPLGFGVYRQSFERLRIGGF